MRASKGDLSEAFRSLGQAAIYEVPVTRSGREGLTKQIVLAVLCVHSQSHLQFPWKHERV